MVSWHHQTSTSASNWSSKLPQTSTSTSTRRTDAKYRNRSRQSNNKQCNISRKNWIHRSKYKVNYYPGCVMFKHVACFWICVLRVEFLLKTDGGYPRDAGVFSHSRWQTLGVPSALTPIGQLHQSPPSPVPGDLWRCPSHQSHVTWT